MAIIKYNAVHVTPKAHFKYILNPNKNEQMKYVTGICCNDDLESVYEDFKEIFERFDSEKFNIRKMSAGKNHIRIHSYIQSFDSSVSAEKAHEIGVKLVKEMFGDNRPVIITTHTNTDHAHNHIAVCPYDIYGVKWHANKTTLKQARFISDKICKEHGLSIIENPRRKSTIPYSEWLARKAGTSWKVKMADDIDRIILDPSVHSIDDLVEMMKSEGYVFTNEKCLICKPQSAKHGCLFAKLGRGYTNIELKMRIIGKYTAYYRIAPSDYTDEQRIVAKYYSDIQRIYYREPVVTDEIVRELRENTELLCFISRNKIHSEKELENYVNNIADKVNKKSNEILHERFAGANYHDISVLEKEKEELNRRKYEAAAMYKRYLELRRRAEAYDYLWSKSTKKHIDPMRDRSTINAILKINKMSEWAEKVHKKAEQLKILEEQSKHHNYIRGYSR